MFNLLENHLLNDIFSRADQSRVSYNLQTEEFRQLNGNLQVYLSDIKRIDDENHDLQNNIEQIRINYILTLENHLKGLPDDFRQQSETLTEAHIERYKSKSRARRFINEREELKRRIHFVTNNEKLQTKHLNNLQKQERSMHNEFLKLNEQIKHLFAYVETERQTHRQAMDKVDNLQLELEGICVERSKTEFEIQTVREEVKLMQTAKEFLDEEHQAMISTQTDANEYLLSRLNESILRIREDFDELNKSQLKQIENEYKQMMEIIEEKTFSNDETKINHQIECEKLQDEHQTIAQELTTLDNHNQILSERILAMEADLYSLRDERRKELMIKNTDLDRSKIELRTLSEKLNNLAEYDRNLKFELTLYRGVLESEYRRKQQQQQLMNNQYPTRPTTLRTSMIRNNKTSPVLTPRSQIESADERTKDQNDKSDRQESLSTKPFDQDQQQEIKTENVISQEEHQTSVASVAHRVTPSAEVQPSPTNGALPGDLSSLSEDRQTPADVEQLSSKAFPTDPEMPSETPKSPSIPQEDREALSEFRHSPSSSTLAKNESPSSEEDQLSTASVEVQPLPAISPAGKKSSLIRNDSIRLEAEETSTDIQQSTFIPPSTVPEKENSPNSSTTSTVLEGQEGSSEVSQSPTILQDVQPSSILPPADEQTSSEMIHSPSENSQTTSDSQQSLSQEDQSISSNIQQTLPQEQSPSSEAQKSLVQEQTSSTDEYQKTTPTSHNQPNPTANDDSSENQLTTSSDQRDSDIEKTNLSAHDTEEKANSDYDNNERHQSAYSIEPSIVEEQRTNSNNKRDSSSVESTNTKQEEEISSSDQNKIEEDNKLIYISSSDYDNTLNDSTLSTHQEPSKISLSYAEDDNTDVIGEVGSPTSPKNEEKESYDNDESDLEAVLQDLRYVYRDLANDENLVEINDNFPDNLIDRLEFGDSSIRTLFDSFLRKYLVQTAKEETRLKTLDWIEFREILFPIITGHYMERHIRKLFDLFDTSNDGYLSLEEISDLLELLQINNTTELAQSMIDDFDTDHDGKLSVDEFIDSVKKADNTNHNILSQETEYKQWYIQRPTDDDEHNDDLSISVEVPTTNFPSKINSNLNDDVIKTINNGISLLGRIFKRVGAEGENKQLDSHKPLLTMKITNEFVNNNIHISSIDLQSFIELYLTKKQNSDHLINWIEFRDLFLPFVNGGMFSKEDIARWFDIIDTNRNGIITREQILLLFHLLQILNSKDVLNEISETYKNNNDSWTLDELLFALENIDETTSHLLSNNEQIQQTTSFDNNWLKKNIF